MIILGGIFLGLFMGFFIDEELSQRDRFIVVVCASLAYGITGQILI
jgi:hypothetical protein